MGLLENMVQSYFGESLQNMISITEQLEGFIVDHYGYDINCEEFSYEEILQQYLWVIQEIFESDCGFRDCCGMPKDIIDENQLDFTYLGYNPYSKGVYIKLNSLVEFFPEIDTFRLDKFIREINSSTTLKLYRQ